MASSAALDDGTIRLLNIDSGNLSEDGVGTALSSTIGTELRKRYPSFDPRNYGCKKLIDLIVKLGFKTTKDSAKIVVTLPAKNKSK